MLASLDVTPAEFPLQPLRPSLHLRPSLIGHFPTGSLWFLFRLYFFPGVKSRPTDPWMVSMGTGGGSGGSRGSGGSAGCAVRLYL